MLEGRGGPVVLVGEGGVVGDAARMHEVVQCHPHLSGEVLLRIDIETGLPGEEILVVAREHGLLEGEGPAREEGLEEIGELSTGTSPRIRQGEMSFHQTRSVKKKGFLNLPPMRVRSGLGVNFR